MATIKLILMLNIIPLWSAGDQVAMPHTLNIHIKCMCVLIYTYKHICHMHQRNIFKKKNKNIRLICMKVCDKDLISHMKN